MTQFDKYIQALEKELAHEKKTHIQSKEVGYVEEVRDGVALLTGLDDVSFGEIVQFSSGVLGTVIDITEDAVGTIILGDYLTIQSGDTATATGRQLSIGVDEAVLGRVVNPIGEMIDGGESIEYKTYMPIEKIAPGVVARKSVSVPLATGIKAIDALIPVGRGQRELIIGDRGVGKTSIAIDTIINQKDSGVMCIYCAVGQKNANVAATVELLRSQGALDHTVIVSATASEPATLQYLAPYAATAIGEYFMSKGKDVLVVYDDLMKHAWAYRQISLILRRPSGREAYPGDVFYLHSRLLERACRLNEEHGGGSLTALPIIETLEGDVSAYIPTNVISITDGQIFLETDMFNAGMRPAVNVGTSVSRVGSAAQTKAMKQVAGKLKLDLAQYRDLAAFSQFESELDEETKKFLNRGARMTQLLKQKKNEPYDLASEVAIIWAGANGYLDSIDVKDVSKFEEQFLAVLHTQGKDIMTAINTKKILEEAEEKELKTYAEDTARLLTNS